MAKVLITGGAGFIGSQLGAALAANGDEVVLVDNMSFGYLDNLVINGKTFGRFECLDIRDIRLAKLMGGVDLIYHLAGLSALPVCQCDPAEAYSVNVGGTAQVLECARRAGVRRMVFSSTSAVYENSAEKLLREDLPVTPDLVYAMTKLAAETLCASFARNYGMDVVICRFFNVYGPHQDIHRTSPPFTSYIARELVFDRRPRLFNRTDALRDYVHVNDVLALLRRVGDAPGRFPGEIVNVCGGRGFSVAQIYEELQRIAQKRIEPSWGEPKMFWDAYPQLFEGGCPLNRERIEKEVWKHAVGDPQKTSDLFGWSAITELSEGLRSVYRHALEAFENRPAMTSASAGR